MGLNHTRRVNGTKGASMNISDISTADLLAEVERLRAALEEES
jgi:hypothetical protein